MTIKSKLKYAGVLSSGDGVDSGSMMSPCTACIFVGVYPDLSAISLYCSAIDDEMSMPLTVDMKGASACYGQH